MVASAVSRGKKPVDAAVGELDEHTALEEGQFRELLEKIDRGLRALPATAQARRWAADRHAGRFNRVACMGAGARFGQLWFFGAAVLLEAVRSKRVHARPGYGQGLRLLGTRRPPAPARKGRSRLSLGLGRRKEVRVESPCEYQG